MTIPFPPKYLFIGFNFLLLSLLTGCALFSDDKNEPNFAKLTIIADQNLNPAIDGRASPVVIRIYQLSQAAKFNNSNFFALYENDQSLLGNNLQTRTEFEITPNKKYQKKLEIKPNTHFIAILAAYRDLDHAQWKKIKNFNSQENSSLIIHLNQNSVQLDIK